MTWHDIPSDQYFADALTLSSEERQRLEAALDVLPSTIIDAHTHIARGEDIDQIAPELLGHIVSTFPVYTLDMAESARRTLWPGKVLRAARMPHALVGYRHTAINNYLRSELPPTDIRIGFGLPSAPEEACRLAQSDGVAALKMYFHCVEPPLRTVVATFPETVLAAAETAGIPIILHLPTSLPGGLVEILDVVSRHPQLKIILAHLGGHGGQTLTEPILASFNRLASVPTIWMDTAFVFDRALIAAAVRALGPTRVIFGTDEPLSLIRAVAYCHPQLGGRLHAPAYHWCHRDEAPADVSRCAPILLHIQMLEAIVDAVGCDRALLQALFHDNMQQCCF